MATPASVAARLAEGFDIIHFCGHIVDDQSGPGLVLADGRPLSAGMIQANLTGRPLVFLNGCASARGHADHSHTSWNRTIASAADACLFGGASAVIGTGCDVSDAVAPDVAGQFYAEALRGVPIGEALRIARRGARGREDARDSLVRLCFVLYGDPQRCIVSTPTAIRASGEGNVRRLSPVGPSPIDAGRPFRRPPTEPRTPRSPVLTVLGLAALCLIAFVGIREIRARVMPSGPVALRMINITGKGYGGAVSLLERSTFMGLTTILYAVSARYPQKLQVYLLPPTPPPGGRSKMEVYGLAGNLLVRGEQAELGVHVTASDGRLVLAKAFPGPTKQLIAMQNDAALAVVQGLGIRLTASDEQDVLAGRDDELGHAFALVAATLPDLSGPFSEDAFSGPDDPEDASLQHLIDAYTDAVEKNDRQALESLGVRLTDAQWAHQSAYHRMARDLRVHGSEPRLLRAGGLTTMSFVRNDSFVGPRGPQKLRVVVSVVLDTSGGRLRVQAPVAPPPVGVAMAQPGERASARRLRRSRPDPYLPAPTTTSTTLPTVTPAPLLFPDWERLTRWRDARLLYRLTGYTKPLDDPETQVSHSGLVSVSIKRAGGVEVLRACCVPLSDCTQTGPDHAICIGVTRHYPRLDRSIVTWWALRRFSDALRLEISPRAANSSFAGFSWREISLPWEAAAWSENDWVIDAFEPAHLGDTPATVARLRATGAGSAFAAFGVDVWFPLRASVPALVEFGSRAYALHDVRKFGSYTLPTTVAARFGTIALENAIFDRGIPEQDLMRPYVDAGIMRGLPDASLGSDPPGIGPAPEDPSSMIRRQEERMRWLRHRPGFLGP